MSEVIEVVLCGDRNVLWGMAVTVRSALENSSMPLSVTVITNGVTETDKEELKASWAHPNLNAVRFAEVDYDMLRRFRSTMYLKSKLTYARYFLEDFLPQTRRLIYLDTDLLVLGDVAELWRTDLQGNVLGVILDISTRSNASHLPLCEKLGIKDPSGYFNGGVLLIDMEAWKANNSKDRLIQVSIDLFDAMDASDQGALNIVFEGKTKQLDVKWNTSQYEADRRFSGGIIHLIGSTKPWHYDYDHVFKDTFYDYLDRTAYAKRRPPHPKSFAALRSKLARKTPTMDMITGKLRRKFSKKEPASSSAA